ncbi:MAG: hypothetical protein A3I66_05135 [Burkholderiales bacterium RIFCSPLOWO2_02_FULL_57_36]|nr:MAG: hypothetical protein A3I66_05135 [Burkholderiales bacterium RIFCSPLOWO2_02_FULL_57_36]
MRFLSLLGMTDWGLGVSATGIPGDARKTPVIPTEQRDEESQTSAEALTVEIPAGAYVRLATTRVIQRQAWDHAPRNLCSRFARNDGVGLFCWMHL